MLMRSKRQADGARRPLVVVRRSEESRGRGGDGRWLEGGAFEGEMGGASGAWWEGPEAKHLLTCPHMPRSDGIQANDGI